MNAEHYHEAVAESTLELRERIEGLSKRQAETLVQEQLNNMTRDGRAVLMSDEEDRMIRAFRSFKSKCRRQGEVFKWQTGPSITVEQMIVDPAETSLLHDPAEAT